MNNNGNNGNKFFEGFLLGLIIGGGAVFLLGTAKGKKLLKAITEEGLENLSDILDEGLDEIEEYEEVEEDVATGVEDANGNGVSKKTSSDDEAKASKPKSVRRFFRRKSS